MDTSASNATPRCRTSICDFVTCGVSVRTCSPIPIHYPKNFQKKIVMGRNVTCSRTQLDFSSRVSQHTQYNLKVTLERGIIHGVVARRDNLLGPICNPIWCKKAPLTSQRAIRQRDIAGHSGSHRCRNRSPSLEPPVVPLHHQNAPGGVAASMWLSNVTIFNRPSICDRTRFPIPLRQRPPMIAGLDSQVPQRHFHEGIQTRRQAGEQNCLCRMDGMSVTLDFDVHGGCASAF